MVLAFASFLVTIGSFSTVPILANYVVECFIDYPVDAAMSNTLFRIVWGLSIPFYINEWAAEVGVGWAYGIMAFMALGATGFIAILMLGGHQVRELSFARVKSSEEGSKIIEKLRRVELRRLDVQFQLSHFNAAVSSQAFGCNLAYHTKSKLREGCLSFLHSQIFDDGPHDLIQILLWEMQLLICQLLTLVGVREAFGECCSVHHICHTPTLACGIHLLSRHHQ